MQARSTIDGVAAGDGVATGGPARPGWRRRLLDLVSRRDLERRLALGLAISACIAGLLTYAVTTWGSLYGAGSGAVLALLNVDLVLLLLLGLVVARQLVRLAVERHQGSAGSRLHVRLAVLFGLLAATPAVVVAIFSVVFLGSGLESWFSSRVSAALDNSVAVANAYLDEHREVIRADALAMAADLEREGPGLLSDPDYLRHLVVAQAALRSLSEAILFDATGQVLAHSGLGVALEVDSLSADVLARAKAGEVVTLTSAADDRIRAVLRLEAPGGLFLFVGRFVDPQVLSFVDRTRQVVDEYRLLQSERSGIQITSALIFGIVALLLLLAAIWIGLNLADRLATPISRLVGAADRLGQGDLGVRVPPSAEDDELARLSRAFNRMADQLEGQRALLIATNEQLDERRRFTEAVLAGVSAGVIGLDAERRVVLPNRMAAEILTEGLASLPLVALDQVFPEALPLFDQLAASPLRLAFAEVELQRGAQRRTLLVRLAAEGDGGQATGYVLTFDDITGLVSAQRQAAWSEVAKRIAHEIKNPLTPIRLSAERLGRRFAGQVALADRESFGRSVTTIIDQVDTIGRLVGEFSAFARMPAARIRDASLAEVLRSAVALQQGAWPTLAISLDLPADDALRLPCDPEKVNQALTNLLQNAIDALGERPGPGRVAVSARHVGQGVQVAVQDDGPGFGAADRTRLFEPYVTTRARGTGLGLAIVKKIMEEHQGRIELADADQGGAVARLWFPHGRSAKPHEHSPPTAGTPNAGTQGEAPALAPDATVPKVG